MKIEIKKNDVTQKLIECKNEITPLQILNQENIQSEHTFVAAKLNNILINLEEKIHYDCTLQFLDISTREGMRVYQDSLTFIFVQAVKTLFQNAKVEVKHSIADGYYIETYFRFLLTESDTEKLKERMKEFISNDEKFIREKVKVSRARKIFADEKIKLNLLENFEDEEITLYKFRDTYDYFTVPLVPSTGYLKLFDLKYTPPGIVLRFPRTNSPDEIGEYQPQKNLLKIFTEYERWGNILELSFADSLNQNIKQKNVGEVIQISEALHEKKIANIAEDIFHKKDFIKLILVAGPSSSGKTTFAKRLAIQLMVTFLSPVLISLDSYFLDRDKTPKDCDGKLDFESINSLDKELVNQHIKKLLDGEEVEIPKFDFRKGKREKSGRKIKLKDGQILIFEGIHGLNDKLTPSIDRKNKYKIYLSALTQLNLDYHNHISTSDTRIIRRIVRDAAFRGYSAHETLKRWDSIRRGEAKYIFKFQEESDAMFNSALVYELGVLKKYAIPALQNVSQEFYEYSEAQRLIRLLSFFLDISEDVIPKNSILREFISGSVFEY